MRLNELRAVILKVGYVGWVLLGFLRFQVHPQFLRCQLLPLTRSPLPATPFTQASPLISTFRSSTGESARGSETQIFQMTGRTDP
ncbi:hypothetical protein E2C01_000592 [Portunus trituberculatus]|uniref:Uncharacterized protein n=1 Tax=Portunus trituberculatus TaxID=210409 RepID=A0A5B7CK56_PORTR|nr:hypothetical protein [Portunus trituberculatus]